MGEKLYKTVGQLGIRVPAHIAHLCEPSEMDRRNHGVGISRTLTASHVRTIGVQITHRKCLKKYRSQP